MEFLNDYLKAKGVSDGLLSIFESLADSVYHISAAINTSDSSKAGTQNVFGEEQLALDVLSDKIMMERLDRNDFCGLYGSEELPDAQDLGEGKYAVVSDPLDGSSLVDVNLAVGTIVGIYESDKLIGVKGDDQVASLIAVYGPSTTVFLTVRQGVAKFIMDDKGRFQLVSDDFRVDEGKMFAPGNLRACAERKEYLDLVNYWCLNGYTLRYSGGMVPDINQILIKGKGIFAYPGYGDQPNGKLRLLYECAPMALLMEEAGGAASDGHVRILEKEVEDLNQRSEIFIGSKEEVKRCEDYLS